MRARRSEACPAVRAASAAARHQISAITSVTSTSWQARPLSHANTVLIRLSTAYAQCLYHRITNRCVAPHCIIDNSSYIKVNRRRTSRCSRPAIPTQNYRLLPDSLSSLNLNRHILLFTNNQFRTTNTHIRSCDTFQFSLSISKRYSKRTALDFIPHSKSDESTPPNQALPHHMLGTTT